MVNLDEEHELSRGIGGADDPLGVEATVKPSWPLIACYDNNNVSFSPQTSVIHQFSSASWWWTCLAPLPYACCPLAYLPGPKIINFQAGFFHLFCLQLFVSNNLLLSDPFKLINQISTVQVVPWLPSVILGKNKSSGDVHSFRIKAPKRSSQCVKKQSMFKIPKTPKCSPRPQSLAI